MRRSVLVASLLLAAACGSDDAGTVAHADAANGDDAAADGSTAGDPSYHEHIRPLLDQHCVSCHTDGGIGPLSFDDPAVPLTFGASIVDAVESQRMPPWIPADDCHDYLDSRGMPAAERAVFEAWRDAGFPEGDPATYVPPVEEPGTSTPPADLSVSWPEAYRPDPLQQDDYRCLPLDLTFDEDTWVTGTHVTPDQTAMVHHVLLYLVEPGATDAVQRRDERDEGPGYTCFGTPGIGSTLIGVWAPGNTPNLWPEGSALRIPAGSVLVPQVHYSLATVTEEQVVPDQTTIELWTRDASDPPEDVVQLIQILDASFMIPAGAESHTTSATFPSPVTGDIVGVFAHMHLLGTKISIELDRADTGENACLVDIPRWDFDWQLLYRFPEESTEAVSLGDQVTLSCEWDNSASNQPVIDGVQIEPRDVEWGDGTLDEMCYGVIAVRRPYVDEPGLCGGFEPCYADCADDDGQCLLGCIFVPGQSCGECMTGALGDCMVENCPAEGAALLACLNDCGDTQTCLLDGCEAEFDVAAECTAPHIRSGACDESFSECEVVFGD